MAKVRIGFSTHFEVENETVGIGTDSALDTLHVTGDITAHNVDAGGGITTITTYSGFIDKEVTLTNPDINLNSKVHSLSGEIIVEGDITVSSATTVTSGSENLTVTDNFTLPGISDDKPTAGTTRFNENLGSLEFYTGVEWKAVNSVVDNGTSGRGIFAGGYEPTLQDITYVNVSTKGNAIAFGNLGTPMMFGGGCSSGTRGLFGGGRGPGPSWTKYNVIQYLTIASTGNTIDFGEITHKRRRVDATSSSTRGLWGSADGTPSTVNIIDYVEISSLGNAKDFGDMSNDAYSRGALSSPTRAVWFGGSNSFPTITNMEFVTIASKGDGVIFGDMTVARSNCAGGGFSNGVRGVIAGGYGISGGNYPLAENIDAIIIASTGNAIDFGKLEQKTRDYNGVQNPVRGLIAGGSDPSTYINVISAISLTTSGESEDFGDLSKPAKALVGLSGSHGGLGGF